MVGKVKVLGVELGLFPDNAYKHSGVEEEIEGHNLIST